jgi:predicted phage tail protein
MVREVKLYGALAKFVGQRRFLAEINSAGEAVRMLLANFPGLEQHMADQHYKVIVDNYESELEEINNPASQRIQIVPVLGGAGSGTGKILAGVALIATAILIGPAAGGFLGLGAGLGGATGAGAAISMGLVGGAFATAVGAVGVALVLGGVSQLISPTPQLGTIGPLGGVGGSGRRQTSTEGTEFDPQESYSFSGIQNTSKQGVPVPVVYGETIVGSVVISAGIDVDTI